MTLLPDIDDEEPEVEPSVEIAEIPSLARRAEAVEPIFTAAPVS